MVKSICTVDACGRFVEGHGLCNMHYQRMVKWGSTDLRVRPPHVAAECSLPTCSDPASARGLCVIHYGRLRRKYGGDLTQNVRGRQVIIPPHERVLARSVLDVDGCWTFTGRLNQHGYATAWDNEQRRARPTHRLVYEALRGPVDPALDLDHLCYNRACVNPDHLDPVTRLDNVRRAHAWERSVAA